MARSLQLFSMLSKIGSLSVTPTICTNSCRFASRDASKARMGQSHVQKASNKSRHSYAMSDEELEFEDEKDVEDKLHALIDKERKRQRTVKYHILRRKMTPSGAPERKLTWDAIEQIRYLKQEQPEEWTVERLAEGFSVSPDVILRVLRSKFSPGPQKKAKQDAKVMATLSQQALSAGVGTAKDRPRLPGNQTPAILPAGSRESAVATVSEQTLMLRGKESGSLASSRVSPPVLASQLPTGINKHNSVTVRSTAEGSSTNPNSTEEEGEEEEEEERWDGRVFSEEELEEFFTMSKPSPVVQVGNDFFDAEGNFLFRI